MKVLSLATPSRRRARPSRYRADPSSRRRRSATATLPRRSPINSFTRECSFGRTRRLRPERTTRRRRGAARHARRRRGTAVVQRRCSGVSRRRRRHDRLASGLSLHLEPVEHHGSPIGLGAERARGTSRPTVRRSGNTQSARTSSTRDRCSTGRSRTAAHDGKHDDRRRRRIGAEWRRSNRYVVVTAHRSGSALNTLDPYWLTDARWTMTSTHGRWLLDVGVGVDKLARPTGGDAGRLSVSRPDVERIAARPPFTSQLKLRHATHHSFPSFRSSPSRLSRCRVQRLDVTFRRARLSRRYEQQSRDRRRRRIRRARR